jgi:C_GCAxxG_C_C family probable redox protein
MSSLIRNVKNGEEKLGNNEIENAAEIAKNYFSSGFNCAEASLLAVCKILKIKSDAVPKIATGFGGGITKFGSICGALSGTIMAMGIVEGRNDAADNTVKVKLYKKVITLIDLFKSEFKNTDCRELTGCNLLTKDGHAKFSNDKIHEEICSKFVEFAVIKGIEILRNN